MICAGIIAEYNPFHNGHKYHIDKTRQLGATHTVCVMSGNFTQRGQGALIPKSARVKAALMCGADLVIELPCIYSIGSAERFAFGAVSILNSLGCVDMLSFGSETGDTALLCNIAKTVETSEFNCLVQQNMASGISYPLARQRALDEIYKADSALSPNDILAVEYIRSLNRLGSPVSPTAVPRVGVMHDDSSISGNYTSASHIRQTVENMLFSDTYTKTDYDSLKPLMPKESLDILMQCIDSGQIYDRTNASRSMLTILRNMGKHQFAELPDVSEGLENRIISSLETSTDIEELFSLIKTKRYTLARIRRIITAAYLGVTAQLQSQPAPYIRILGANDRGREILSVAGKSASLPIIGTMAAAKQLLPDAKRVFELECRAGNLYGMMTKQVLPCGLEQKLGVINI